MSQAGLFPAGAAAESAVPANALRRPIEALAEGLPPDWAPVGQRFLSSPPGRRVCEHIRARLAAGAVIYPADPFKALRLTPRVGVRVVILGQDPYHGPGQAEGLAFSVPDGIKPPPSLRNIHKELARDLGLPAPPTGSLAGWAARGVLLLNTVLTVEDGQAGSHQKIGWEALTDDIVSVLCEDESPKVFMLWGAPAQAWAPRIGARHRVLLANHPSPLSALRPPRPFIGCGHFSAARDFLREVGHAAPDPWAPEPGVPVPQRGHRD